MRAELRRLPPGTYAAEDVLDDDGLGASRIRIAVRIRVGGGHVDVDFSGTAPQVRGPVNANYAVTRSAVLYVFRALATEPIPPNDGMARPLRIHAPAGSVVNADFPAAVAGGNVETSQRIVDVVLRALARAVPDRIPAASCGSMNNIALGGSVGGRVFAYYETLAGGAGASASGPGASALHTHMTNTMNTPIEALEAYYPLRITRYAVRRGSGGRGRHAGGCGVVREIEFLSAARVTLLTERRSERPYGLEGGEGGRPGVNELLRRGRRVRLPGKTSFDVLPGDRLSVQTPGGGGFGRHPRR
jgi:N-methylhydantoinase B